MLGIGRTKARERAEDAAIAGGYSWREPVKVERTLRYYYVISNWRSRGGAVCVKIGARRGEVISISASRL